MKTRGKPLVSGAIKLSLNNLAEYLLDLLVRPDHADLSSTFVKSVQTSRIVR